MGFYASDIKKERELLKLQFPFRSSLLFGNLCYHLIQQRLCRSLVRTNGGIVELYLGLRARPSGTEPKV